jgi:hypothetical protein
MKKIYLLLTILAGLLFFSTRMSAQTTEPPDTNKKKPVELKKEVAEPVKSEEMVSPETESPYNLKSEPVPNAEIFIEQDNTKPVNNPNKPKKDPKKDPKKEEEPLKEDPKK